MFEWSTNISSEQSVGTVGRPTSLLWTVILGSSEPVWCAARQGQWTHPRISQPLRADWAHNNLFIESYFCTLPKSTKRYDGYRNESNANHEHIKITAQHKFLRHVLDLIKVNYTNYIKLYQIVNVKLSQFRVLLVNSSRCYPQVQGVLLPRCPGPGLAPCQPALVASVLQGCLWIIGYWRSGRTMCDEVRNCFEWVSI